MNIKLNIDFYDGGTNISPDLKMDIVTKFPAGDITTSIVLNAGNLSEVVELIDDKGIGNYVTFAYATATGQLTITADFKLPVDIINLNTVISSSTLPETIALDIDMYDVSITADVFIIDDPINIKASTLFLQQPLTDIIKYYNLTNSTITRCTIVEGTDIISFSPSGYYTKAYSSDIITTYTYEYYSGATLNTVTDTDTKTVTHNTFVPNTNTAFTNNGYLFNGFPTVNTVFDAQIASDYSLISTSPQTSRIMNVNIVSFKLNKLIGTTIYSQWLAEFVTNNTTALRFDFADLTNITDGDYIAELTNYLPIDYSVKPDSSPVLTSGKYYYVATKGTCTAITDGVTPITITNVTQVIYIDPTNYGLAGTSITFTGFNELTLIPVDRITDTTNDFAYYILDGTLDIDGVTHNQGEIVILPKESTIDISSTASLVLMELDVISNTEYPVRTYNDITISNPECGVYSIYNNSLNAITATISQLIYTVDKQGEYEIIDTITIPSNSVSNFSPTADGIYKFDFTDANNIEVYYIVNVCNIETCLVKYINELVCCSNDSNCKCNLQTHDCKYIDRANFIAASLLYDTLKDMIIDIIGYDTVYNDIKSDDLLMLHSVTDIINRLNNFCNTCE